MDWCGEINKIKIKILMNLIALLAGAIGGMLSSLLVNYFRKELEFKYNYKEYILNKRQEAYKEVETLMLYLEKQGEDDQWSSIPSVFTEEAFASIRDEVDKIIDGFQIWLSNDALKTIKELRTLIYGIEIDARQSPEWDQSLMNKLWNDYSKNLFSLLRTLKKVFFLDIKNLDKIKKFKKEKVLGD